MSDVITISNEFLEVSVSVLGAELKSIFSKKTSKQLLWQGDKDIWKGQAPVLFPFIGRLKEKKYTFEGKEYTMDIHGFARTSIFAVAYKSDTHMVFELKDSPETEKDYPFNFSFSVSYKLEGNKLVKEHAVENRTGKTMLFEIGGHEGYSLELFEGDKMTDYALRFPDETELQTYTVDENTMLNEKTSVIDIPGGALKLSPEIFKGDALILENLKQNTVELHHKKEGKIAAVDFADFPYIGVWTKYIPENARYVCLEPWSSLPDGNYLDYAFENKQDVVKVEAGETKTLGYTMTFFK